MEIEMEEKKRYETRDLIEGAEEELEERIKWCMINNEEDYEEHDLIAEVSDNNIPIYTYDLLQYASNNFDLLQPNDLAGDSPNVDKIIQANIYEILNEALYEYLTTRKED
jgi:hypothetical protein